MNCRTLTYENHKVELAGRSMSQAMIMGLVGLQWVRVNGTALLRGRVGTRELFTAVMADPNHLLHPEACTCGVGGGATSSDHRGQLNEEQL